jgi:hypothetical protein
MILWSKLSRSVGGRALLMGGDVVPPAGSSTILGGRGPTRNPGNPPPILRGRPKLSLTRPRRRIT